MYVSFETLVWCCALCAAVCGIWRARRRDKRAAALDALLDNREIESQFSAAAEKTIQRLSERAPRPRYWAERLRRMVAEEGSATYLARVRALHAAFTPRELAALAALRDRFPGLRKKTNECQRACARAVVEIVKELDRKARRPEQSAAREIAAWPRL